MKAVAFVGFKDSGKTETIVSVSRELGKLGLKVGVLKKAHGKIDVEGKDSSRLSEVSDVVVLISDLGKGAAFFKSLDVSKALSLLSNVDVLLLEGFKELKVLPKVYCLREESELEELEDGLGIAISGRIAEYRRGEEIKGLRVYDPREDSKELAEKILRKGFMLPGLNCGECGMNCYEMAKRIVSGERSPEDCKVRRTRVRIFADGKEIPLKPWVQELVENVVRGIVSSLKGCTGKEGEIKLIVEGKK